MGRGGLALLLGHLCGDGRDKTHDGAEDGQIARQLCFMEGKEPEPFLITRLLLSGGACDPSMCVRDRQRAAHTHAPAVMPICLRSVQV